MKGLKVPICVAFGGSLLLVLVPFIVPANPPVADATPNSDHRDRRNLEPELPTGTTTTRPPAEVPPQPASENEGTSEPKRAPVLKPGKTDLRPMLMFFERQLELDRNQVRHIKKVLAEREIRVEKIRARVRESAIFDKPLVQQELKDLKAWSYREMSLNMDPYQREAFDAIVAEGRFGDSIVVPIPNDAVVIER